MERKETGERKKRGSRSAWVDQLRSATSSHRIRTPEGKARKTKKNRGKK